MTRFAVSITKRTLSVSVPSRSQSTARTRGAASATAAALDGRRGRGDREHRLLGDTPVARFLPPADERLELVVQRIGVLETGVHDLESQVAHGVELGEPLEHHLADPERGDLRRAALLDRRLDVVDEPVDRLGHQLLRGGLPDGGGELAAIELLPRSVALHHLDPCRLRAFARGESLATLVAGAAAADRLTVLRLARID